jgi:glycosyltransferase involved in cell wall biosynthesis
MSPTAERGRAKAGAEPRASSDAGAFDVLHVISTLTTGGTENLMVNHLGELARAYPEARNHLCVLSPGADPDYLARLPVQPMFLDFSGRYRNPRDVIATVLRLRRLIRALKPRVVHTYLWSADIVGALAVIGLPVGRVVHVVDRRLDWNADRLAPRLKTRWTARLLRPGRTRFVAVSDACREHSLQNLRLSPQAVLTAHNGIVPEAFARTSRAPFSARPVQLGAISRFAEEKGHPQLLDAMRILVQAGQPVRLMIAGSGRTLGEQKARAAELGLQDHVEFLGRVPSAAAFYRELDAFLVPSVSAEGLPTTILEAMACGLPVIATDVGGAAEAIDHGKQGLIVAPGDPAALADAVRRLVDDPEAARRMGEAGYQRVRAQFTVTNMTRTIVEGAYRPLLQEARAAQRA